MVKAITINLLRVSPAGDAIDFSIDCPFDYYFTDFEVEVLGVEDAKYNINHIFLLDGEYNTFQKRFAGSIPLSELGQEGEKRMYKIVIRAKHDCQECLAIDSPYIEANVLISDVSGVYSCLMDDVLSLDAKCGNSEALDNLSRNYMILMAHQMAMNFGYEDEAMRYFNMLSNCFKKCASKCRNVGSTCGCGTQPIVKPKKTTGCGCGKK